MVAETILITGANRGLGLEFVKQLVALNEPPALLFATCRNPSEAKELKDVLEKASKTKSHILQLDVSNEEELKSVALTVIKECGSRGLNLLINNAGVMDKGVTKWEEVSMQSMLEHYMINTISPTILTTLLLPALRAAANQQDGEEMSVSRAAVVHMSTFLSSIKELGKFTFNDNTCWYPYRASKTALNMIARCMAIDLQKDHILVLPLHPGWVKTDMGGDEAMLTPEHSVAGMLQIMRQASAKDAGVLTGWDGYVLPW